ncbi:hypothetical protein ABH920_009954 [Catenulispora sp. EB89]|uniref:DNA-binding protein n=1 Tax=Catenulispora sp. EB89 TaxID=3156257 RepID=UPI003513ADCA
MSGSQHTNQDTTIENSALTPEDAASLLAAGAILPPGTAVASERAVSLTARTYRHPGLDDRVVVRLTPGVLGAAEDAAAGFLGLAPDGEPAEVGLGLRASLGFPEWVLVHHPEDGHQALALLPELERAGKQAKSRPKAALQAYQGIADRLGAALPHFLPTYYEQVGRVFLAAESVTFASQMFTKARRAESAHGLELDEDRLDEVFLEFALAGALPAKALVEYGKALSARVSPAEALERYVSLCSRRTAGGLTPSAQLAAELRRLAKASGADAAAVEREYLAGLLTLPATLRAPEGWWKSHRAAIVALVREDEQIRRALLNAMPSADDAGLPGLWLAVLTESGAIAGLYDEAPAEAVRPEDGAAGWLRRFQSMRSGWRARGRMPELYSLVERCQGRLRDELDAAGGTLDPQGDLDLLDLLLALKVPVADPVEHLSLPLEAWGAGDGQRDLVALVADGRFVAAFARGTQSFGTDESTRRAIKKLIAAPGGRVLLTDWVAAVAGEFAATGLPALPAAMTRLGWLPGEALALAEEQVRAAVRTDLAPVLARTLRAGLLDEFGWPAWEQAVAELASTKNVEDLIVADAWPYLIVGGPTQVRVLGADGPVLTHDLRIPANDAYDNPGYHYVDGELLVLWSSRALDGRLRGYWHHSPDRLFAVERSEPERSRDARSLRMYYYGPGRLRRSLPLPGGGRTTGNAPLRPGDSAVPTDLEIMSDGVSYWVWTWDGANHETAAWYEYDPATGQTGRRSAPAFVADALKSAPSGSELLGGQVVPAVLDQAGPTVRPVDGLLGFRIIKLPDGSLRGEDLSGVTVTAPAGTAGISGAIVFPGDEAGRALVGSGSYEISVLDAEGVLVAQAKTDGKPGPYVKGTVLLPPASYWRYLRPREEQASLALRGIDRDTAAALLAAGADIAAPTPEQAKAARLARIRELLPRVTDEALLKGVAGIVRHAAKQQSKLDQVAERLEQTLQGGPGESGLEDAGPKDDAVTAALGGLVNQGYYSWRRETEPGLFAVLRMLAKELRDPPRRARPVRVHVDGPVLPSTQLWEAAIAAAPAAALRSVSPFTEPGHRDTLRSLLTELEALGLAEPAEQSTWRRFAGHVLRSELRAPDHRDSWLGLLPLDGGGCAAFLDYSWDSPHFEFSGLIHDPAGRFEPPALPAPYRVTSLTSLAPVAPSGTDRRPGWLGAFLTEAAAHEDVAPWFATAAEEFAALTGVTPTTAKLVVAGLPRFNRQERGFLPREVCTALGVTSTEAAVARDRLTALGLPIAIELVSALLPADPATLWTQGPDVAAAAEVWNRSVGRQVSVPEALSAEARRAVRTDWDVLDALPALLDPASSRRLSVDLTWRITGDRARPTDDKAVGFDATALAGAVSLAAWLAHRLPAGDPVRSALPTAFAAMRERLANPELMLDLRRFVGLEEFRKTAGAPTEVGQGFERYGAVVMATHDSQPAPALKVPLLDAAGTDPYIPALRGEAQQPFPAEVALRLARDPRFAALLADPGDPAAGTRDADGTWSPQDPTRSVPELVTEAAKELGAGEDAAAVYLMLLAMPDPTDRNTARWTGWKPARLKAARAELARTEAVVEAARARAGRTLFLPGGWVDIRSPHTPMEAWKLPFFEGLLHDRGAVLGVLVPAEPAADLYRRAWQRLQDGDAPRFEELKTARRGRRR